MKKCCILCFALALALLPCLAQGAESSAFSLTLAGGDGPTNITITLSPDRRQYVIRANGAIGRVASCTNPSDNEYELDCPASQINGFVVKTRGGNDTVTVGSSVPVSVIASGGTGIDALTGGGNTDRLVGGGGADILRGRSGADLLYGGGGPDELFGGPGMDVLRGGPDLDTLVGGPGRDDVRQ